MASNFSFDRLTLAQEIKPFDCDIPDLNEFLLEDALNYLRQLLAVTYVIEDDDNNKTVAYFSVLNDKITLTDTASKAFWKKYISKPLHFEKRGLSSFPAVKIGRLAVSIDFKRQGIGRMIIDWVKESFTNENKTGCLFITVDALNRPDTIGFYKSCGFTFLNPEKDVDDNTRLMYYCLLEKKE